MLHLETNHKTKIKIELNPDRLIEWLSLREDNQNPGETVEDWIKDWCKLNYLELKTATSTRISFEADKVFQISRSQVGNSSSGL